MDIRSLLRENIKTLKPYSSARDEFKGTASVYIDANENPFGLDYSRYPDPLQTKLKQKISEFKKVEVEKIFLGNGSDEIIDLLIRAFCEPGKDSIMSMDPSYGMYKVSADINDVKVKKVKTNPDFTLDINLMIEALDPTVKIVFLCSPNNPSGNVIPVKDILKLLQSFQGIVVLDEAYNDFTDTESMISYIDQYPNLLVSQTLSKAFGAASMRLGMAFANPQLVQILNSIKPPYNISQPSQDEALKRLDEVEKIRDYIEIIIRERKKMELMLTSYDGILEIFPSEANFILIRVEDANALYHFLMSNGVIIRNRHGQTHCDNCVRITVGTPDENEILYQKLNEFYHAKDLVSR